MGETELHVDDDGYVLCPRRGEVSVEWCDGCPYRLYTERNGPRVVVVCDPGPLSADHAWASGLRDVPDLWR